MKHLNPRYKEAHFEFGFFDKEGDRNIAIAFRFATAKEAMLYMKNGGDPKALAVPFFVDETGKETWE